MNFLLFSYVLNRLIFQKRALRLMFFRKTRERAVSLFRQLLSNLILIFPTFVLLDARYSHAKSPNKPPESIFFKTSKNT